MYTNPIFAIDFYKADHASQYPQGTELVYSNLTARSDKWAPVLPDFDHKIVLFGFQSVAQWLLTDMWDEYFFTLSRDYVVDRYKKLMDTALGEGAIDVKRIADLHQFGHLPVNIKTLPEGTRCPLRVPFLTIQNTHSEFAWITNFLETQLSASLWKPITTATIAFEYKRLLMKKAIETGSPLEFVNWQGHDFSARGMSGVFDSALAGVGHLLSFWGTDTVAAIEHADEFYRFGDLSGFIGGSVPATEHSVMCMGGEEDEIETFRRLIQDIYPSGVVSIVSDTWDFWRVLTDFAPKLKNIIMNRQKNPLGLAKVVFRPDSGDPVHIICGDPEAPVGTPEHKGAVECLWDVFGGTVTSTGHRMLDEHVGVIYGDSITLQRASDILAGLERKGFASGNIVFGIGSHTYQYITRDTFGLAMKATYGVVNGEGRVLFKSPKTDSGMKFSARGLLRVEREDGEYVLHEMQTPEQEKQGCLKTIFEDGLTICGDLTIEDLRGRLNEELSKVI